MAKSGAHQTPTAPSPSPREARTGRRVGRGVLQHAGPFSDYGAPPLPGPLLRSERRRGKRRRAALMPLEGGAFGRVRTRQDGWPVKRCEPQTGTLRLATVRARSPFYCPTRGGQLILLNDDSEELFENRCGHSNCNPARLLRETPTECKKHYHPNSRTDKCVCDPMRGLLD